MTAKRRLAVFACDDGEHHQAGGRRVLGLWPGAIVETLRHDREVLAVDLSEVERPAGAGQRDVECLVELLGNAEVVGEQVRGACRDDCDRATVSRQRWMPLDRYDELDEFFARFMNHA